MTTASFDALATAVVGESEASDWASAVLEWQMVGVEHDPEARGVCVCGQTGLAHLFTIRNQHNDAWLYPIGSTCINQFGRADLDRDVDVLPGLLGLREALRTQQRVDLTADHFSRAMLAYLYEEGAFPPDRWNGGDGRNDYEFLLKMFNKRNKDEITHPQRRKISALLNGRVFPFVRSDERLTESPS